MISARTRGGDPDNRVTVLICTHLPKAGKISRLGLYGIRRSASTVRQVQPAEETIESAARKDVGVKTRIGERGVVRAATREPERVCITGDRRGLQVM